LEKLIKLKALTASLQNLKNN